MRKTLTLSILPATLAILALSALPVFASPVHRSHHRIHREARAPYDHAPPYWSDQFYGGVPLGYFGSPTYGLARYY